MPPAAARQAASKSAACAASSASGSSGSCRALSAAPLASSHRDPASSLARGSGQRSETVAKMSRWRRLLIRQESGRHERSTYATFTPLAPDFRPLVLMGRVERLADGGGAGVPDSHVPRRHGAGRCGAGQLGPGRTRPAERGDWDAERLRETGHQPEPGGVVLGGHPAPARPAGRPGRGRAGRHRAVAGLHVQEVVVIHPQIVMWVFHPSSHMQQPMKRDRSCSAARRPAVSQVTAYETRPPGLALR